MAATGSRGSDAVVFVGGSDNPYNYNGVGYNGVPSEPVREVWAYSLNANQWRSLGEQVEATMDHRGLLETTDGFVTVGGMLTGQEVSAHVTLYAFDKSGTE